MSGVTTETCIEGGQDMTGIISGDWSAYNNINLTGVNTFVARAASASRGGNIEIHLDSPAGTLLARARFREPAAGRTYADAYCKISGASGTHDGLSGLYRRRAGVCSIWSFLASLRAAGLFAPIGAWQHLFLEVIGQRQVCHAPNGGIPHLDRPKRDRLARPEAISNRTMRAAATSRLLALVNTKYVTAENDGASPLIANRTGVAVGKRLRSSHAGDGNIALRAMNNGMYVTARTTAAPTPRLRTAPPLAPGNPLRRIL